MQNNFCVIFFERKIQGSASSGSYISLEEVILNKSTTCRRQISLPIGNITLKNILLCKEIFQIITNPFRIYLVVESLVGTRLRYYALRICSFCPYKGLWLE